MPLGVYVRSEDHKRNLGLALRGKKRTPEQRRRMSEACKRRPNARKGKHYPNEQGINASNWRGGKPHCLDCGKEIGYEHLRCHSCKIKMQWKGDEASFSTLHKWISNHKPKPDVCECCQEVPPYDLANISGEYHRDINDFEWLCRRCHMVKDGRLEAARLRAPHTRELHLAKAQA